MTISQEILQGKLGRPFKFLQRVDSTNDVARAWLEEGAPAGAVVIADEQLRGRGRAGRSWYTPPGVALALSVLLQPPVEHSARIPMLAALSVYDLAEKVGCQDVGIKWPNDVQVAGKKISGILPENVWVGDRLLGVVLGIGVNVRLDFKHTALQQTAISLEDVVEKRLERADLIASLLARIDYWYALIDTTGLVFQSWKSRLNMLNQEIKVGEQAGLALDVRADGSLLLRDATRGIQTIYAGDVFVMNNRERR